MKKVYKAPLTKVVKIKAEKMLTGSTFNVKSTAIDQDEPGLVKAGKDYDDEDAFDDLW